MLEDRLTPATYYWCGTEYTPASSWLQTPEQENFTVPRANDAIVFGVPGGIGPMFNGEPTSPPAKSQQGFLVKTGGNLNIDQSLEIAGYTNPAVGTSPSREMTCGTGRRKLTGLGSYVSGVAR